MPNIIPKLKYAKAKYFIFLGPTLVKIIFIIKCTNINTLEQPIFCIFSTIVVFQVLPLHIRGFSKYLCQIFGKNSPTILCGGIMNKDMNKWIQEM